MIFKRIGAYLIDIMLVNIISSLLFLLPCFKADYKYYEESYNKYMDTLTSNEKIKEDKVTDIIYNLNKSTKPLLIITTGVSFFYFGVFAYIAKGRTLGKKMMKIQVVGIDGKLNSNLFILRSILITNLIPNVVTIIALSLFGKTKALNIIGVTNMLANTFMLVNILTIFVKKENRALHDYICKTKVIEFKKEENLA